VSLISYLFLLLLYFSVREIGSLRFLALITLTLVFIGVSSVQVSLFSSLSNFLVFLLYLIVVCFLSTSSLLVFFIIFELSLFPVCLLILFIGYQPEKIKSMFYILLYTVVCSAPFLFFAVSLNTRILTGLSPSSRYARFLVCLSFMVKSPLYSLHSWLPKAHVEAPLIGSILLSGVILKLGSYGLLLLAPQLTSSASVFIYLTLSGGVICSTICFRNWDMKSLVAYSSIVHIGVITLGALSGLEVGFWVACGILVGHTLLSPLLFLLAFELYLSSGSRSFICGHNSSVCVGLLLALSLCAGLNFGLPPFLNFWVEVSLFAVQGQSWALSLIPLSLTAFLSFLFSILFYVLSCGGSPNSSFQVDSSLYLYLPCIILSLLLALGSSILLF